MQSTMKTCFDELKELVKEGKADATELDLFHGYLASLPQNERAIVLSKSLAELSNPQ